MRANNFKDIAGQKFGRLTAIECVGTDKNKRALWKCKCECGNEVVVIGKSLRIGNTKSCGCFNIESSTDRIVKLNTKHGKSHTRLFRVWTSMITRCTNPKSNNYGVYGARGITVCDEWMNDFESFYNWAMSQGYVEDAKRGEYTVDRIDSNKGYYPANCRLANYYQQADNRRSTRHITFNGKTMNLAEWARYYGRSKSAFEGQSDSDVLKKMNAYEKYLRDHNTNTLPKRVNL